MNLKNKQYVGMCVRGSGGVDNVIGNSKTITKQTFLKLVVIDKTTQKNIQTHPNDYRFYKNTENFEGNSIYFLLWKSNLLFYQ